MVGAIIRGLVRGLVRGLAAGWLMVIGPYLALKFFIPLGEFMANISFGAGSNAMVNTTENLEQVILGVMSGPSLTYVALGILAISLVSGIAQRKGMPMIMGAASALTLHYAPSIVLTTFGFGSLDSDSSFTPGAKSLFTTITMLVGVIGVWYFLMNGESESRATPEGSATPEDNEPPTLSTLHERQHQANSDELAVISSPSHLNNEESAKVTAGKRKIILD